MIEFVMMYASSLFLAFAGYLLTELIPNHQVRSVMSKVMIAVIIITLVGWCIPCVRNYLCP